MVRNYLPLWASEFNRFFCEILVAILWGFVMCSFGDRFAFFFLLLMVMNFLRHRITFLTMQWCFFKWLHVGRSRHPRHQNKKIFLVNILGNWKRTFTNKHPPSKQANFPTLISRSGNTSQLKRKFQYLYQNTHFIRRNLNFGNVFVHCPIDKILYHSRWKQIVYLTIESNSLMKKKVCSWTVMNHSVKNDLLIQQHLTFSYWN